MNKSRTDPHLRLVQDRSESSPIIPKPATAAKVEQLQLFPEQRAGLVAFIELSLAFETRFLVLVEKMRPQLVLDFRRSPRFDFGSLTRRRVFSSFSRNGIEYVDIHGGFDRSIDIEDVWREIATTRFSRERTRSLAVLVDNPSASERLEESIRRNLEPPKGRDWEFFECNEA